jgi:membrane-bound ClpP family serine protease
MGTMADRSVKDQVISGLSLAASIVFGIAVIGMFCGGIISILHPERVRPESFLLRRVGIGMASFSAAWIFLAISTAILIFTMDRWVKVIPGLFAYSTLGGAIMLSGKYSGVPVPWNVAVFLIFFTILTAAVSFTFQRRKLRVMDRVAWMAFLFCCGIGTSPNPSTMFTALSIGFTFLLSAWGVNHLQRRSQPKWPRIADHR